jgi:hypothetical protein
MTTGMRSISRLLYWMVVADLFVVALSLRFGMHWLISSQVAFISSLLATLASFWSYKRLIEKKIATGDIPPEDRDELDTIDDRFELYDDEETAPAPGAEELKQVIKEERRKIGGLKKGMQNLAVTISAAVSPLRVAAYVILVLGFLYLNRHDLLEIWGYVLGLTVVPLVALFEGRRAG